MKITYANIPLCDAAQRPADISISARRKIQAENIINAQKAALFDRGNCSYTAEFSVEIFHRSRMDAQRFLLEKTLEVQDLSPADLVFELEPDPSQKSEVLTLKNAVLLRSAASLDELRTLHKYEFVAIKLER